MNSIIKRVGTTYVPVTNPEVASKWYQDKLGAVENFRNEEKAILDFANQAFFLVKAQSNEKNSFRDSNNNVHFTQTFEVNGLDQLHLLHQTLKEQQVQVGEIEDRGHPGNNFVFYDLDGNLFDVWSELSPEFKEKYNLKDE